MPSIIATVPFTERFCLPSEVIVTVTLIAVVNTIVITAVQSQKAVRSQKEDSEVSGQ